MLAPFLAARGIRTLTSAEQTFYDGFIGAASSDNPKQALTGVDKTIPQTIIDTVIADIENAHPLLAALDIVNTYGSTKWIMAIDKKQLSSGSLIELDEKWETEKDLLHVEIWKYDPALFAEDHVVDPVSMAVSLRDCPDERVQGEVEGFMEAHQW